MDICMILRRQVSVHRRSAPTRAREGESEERTCDERGGGRSSHSDDSRTDVSPSRLRLLLPRLRLSSVVVVRHLTQISRKRHI